jgi:predicted acyltransferase
LVFPFFLFAVGVSITLALGRRRSAGDSAGILTGRVIRRVVIIFGLGLVLNGTAALAFGTGVDTIRVMGVLQRIALCYLGAGACLAPPNALPSASLRAL